ncbi:MAG: glycoside hydrolase family 2 protein [Lacinutrix sp.]|uniref:beta-mannosidase n=1 Tax=Lacinutrix sp. TaxID=1937692 RepID=UPI003098D57D
MKIITGWFQLILFMIMNRVFCILLLVLCFSCKNETPPTTFEISENWTFKNAKDTTWLSAEVPGEVHIDLFKNNKIKDPFVANNEEELQWISQENWEYKTSFKVEENTLERKHLELHFNGLDTYTSVYLNDSLILKSNNAFRCYNVDIKQIVKAENELKIVFENTNAPEEKAKTKLPYQLPEGNRIFTRKAQFTYGWDWAPKFITSGISKPIGLVAWDEFKIENIHVRQLTLNENKSGLALEIESSSKFKKKYEYDVFINGSLYKSFNKMPKVTPYLILPIIIKKPKFWWPHNLGEPYLYNIKVVVKDGNKVLDSISVNKGLRTIELITEKDSIGESFYFKVNNVPVYAKGANYIPQNSFQNQANDAHYEKLLSDVVAANMNMLRVWGGGIYENDIFYDLCDEKGILVWQDFMFACAMYPGDDAFLNNVKIEAKQQVKRLRNHASIALWCGNNESSEGWKRWGWQENRSEDEKTEIWTNYLKLFDTILPKIVRENTDTDYWETSPKYGRGNPKYKTEGDAHDWWIWHDEYPFPHLQENVPRFMSEFGFQTFPSFETIKYINGNDSISISSKAFSSHQKHARGFSIIKNYMERDFPVPDNDEDYVYVSQLLQAHGITMGIEAQRRAKPYNMGTLYWQLNDCWPVTSWSSIDYFGNWKALHYKAKESFEDVLVSNTIKGNIIEVFVVNDLLESVKGNLEVEIRNFNGDSIWAINKDIETPKLSSKREYRINYRGLEFNKKEALLITTLNGKIRLDYFVSPKELRLPHGDIESKIMKTHNGFFIELSSKVLQKDVFLYSNEKGHFSDNFFDMLPNETRVIQFKTEALQLNDLKIKTFNKLLR